MFIVLGERALVLTLPRLYSFRNSFHSATPWALRMSAETGSSFGARETLSNFSPASCGSRLPLRVFTSLLDHTRFSHVSAPPRERGRTWSRLPSSGYCQLRLSTSTIVLFSMSDIIFVVCLRLVRARPLSFSEP